MTTTTHSAGGGVYKLFESTNVSDLSNFAERLSSGRINGQERDENGQTFLMAASTQGRLDIVLALLETDANVNAVDYDDWSALHYTCKFGHVAIISALLENGANKEQRDVGGWTPLVWCCYKGHVEAAEVMMEAGADITVRGKHHMSSLMWAAGRGHIDVVRLLLDRGANVNVTDKYGSTPLVWACRRGHYVITRMLLDDGAHVDTPGMYSWTALIAAAKFGSTDCVQVLLEHNPHVNALDKDGCSALLLCCRGGYRECVQALIDKGAYVNVTDKNGDSILHHAVKSGDFEVVRMLLKKYADVNVQGSDQKTPLYCTVEKGHYHIAKLILDSHPDLELANKDGDTPLMKAIRTRNADLVELLLDKGAKVSSIDKKEDTCLHIALRNRARKITELLLKNPKNSRLLYRANKAGETPYMIDSGHTKSILTQIFGARHLNASEANENLLGYDIYSSTIADVLSEPTLCTPINVGLFAKWGSGKSFLLDKLKREMKLFEHRMVDVTFQITALVVVVNMIISVVISLPIGFAAGYQVGIGVGGGFLIILLTVQGIIWYGADVKEWEWAFNVSIHLYRQLSNFKLLLSVIFCNPPEVDKETSLVKFLFTGYNKLTSFSGEQSIAMMVASLAEEVENEIGVIPARLFHVFNTKRDNGQHKYHSVCCVPTFVIVIVFCLCLVAITVLLCVYRLDNLLVEDTPVFSVIVTLSIVIGLALIGNLYTWSRMVVALARPQKRRVLRAIQRMKSDNVDKLIGVLKREVGILTRMVCCMNGFTRSQYRLVVFVDGLDSSEQEKLLQVLDMVSVLFSEIDSPFMTILAVDPHIIIKGIEQNLPSLFRDSNINGHDYLRNIVHLPVFLQNQGVAAIAQVKQQQQQQQAHRASMNDVRNPPNKESPPKDYSADSRRSSRRRKLPNFQRQESFMSNSSLVDKGLHRKKKRAESMMGDTSRLTAFGSQSQPFFQSTTDLTRTLMKTDYFSDLNPRTMRRLMNIVAVTARLLRAYGIDYSWHRLATWVNLTEQWPYRSSWVILYLEDNDELADTVTVNELYQRVVNRIPISREVEPLLDIDRNVKKFDAYLSSMSPALQVSDMRRFLASCINVDPFLRKRIREYTNTFESHLADVSLLGRTAVAQTPAPVDPGILRALPVDVSQQISPLRYPPYGYYPPTYTPSAHPPQGAYTHGAGGLVSRNSPGASTLSSSLYPPYLPSHSTSAKKIYIKGKLPVAPLGSLDLSAVSSLLAGLVGVSAAALDGYVLNLVTNNINGFVLENCELDELKIVLGMNFGDWQLFRALVLGLRARELNREDCEYQIVSVDSDEVDKPRTPLAVSSPQPQFTMSRPALQFATTATNVPSPQHSQTQLNDQHATLSHHVQLSPRPITKKSRNSSLAKMVHMENILLNEVIDEFSEGSDEAGDDDDDLEQGLLNNDDHAMARLDARQLMSDENYRATTVALPKNNGTAKKKLAYVDAVDDDDSSDDEDPRSRPFHGLKAKMNKILQRTDTFESSRSQTYELVPASDSVAPLDHGADERKSRSLSELSEKRSPGSERVVQLPPENVALKHLNRKTSHKFSVSRVKENPLREEDELDYLSPGTSRSMEEVSIDIDHEPKGVKAELFLNKYYTGV